MNVGLYARVSTSDQDCAMQLSELRDYCTRRGWAIYDEYVDTGWSGRRNDRPEFLRLMADAGLHRFDAVLVWKMDRFGRSLLQLTSSLQELTSHGIRFIAISQSLDTDQANPTAKLLLHVLAAVAEFEAEMTRERVKAGIEHARRVGTKTGRPHGGQKKIFRRDQVLELHDQGLSYREIGRELKIGLGTVARICSANPSAGDGQASDTAGSRIAS